MNIRKGYYQHYKGNYYQVFNIVKHSETVEEMVLYKALYDEQGLWVRPIAMFEEHVSVHNYQGPRFIYLGEDKSVLPIS